MQEENLERVIEKTYTRSVFVNRLNHLIYYVAIKMATDPEHCGGDPELESDIHCLALLIDYLTPKQES